MNNKRTMLLLLCSASILWHPVLPWDAQILLNYILPLASMIETQELNWFISENLQTKNTENLQEFIITVQTEILVTQTVITNNTDVRARETENKRNYMGLVLTTGPDDYIMTVHDKVLKGRHYYLNFIILVEDVDDLYIVRQILRGMERRNFQNTFLYVCYKNGSSDLYGYSNVPDFQMELRTDLFRYLKTALSSFAYGGLDSKGFVYKTPLRQDIPFVFKSIDRQGKAVQSGTSYKILELFMESINATLKVYEMPKDALGGEVIDMRAAIDLVRKGEVLLLGHTYALFTTDDDVDQSFPIMMVRWCLMVPIWNTVSALYYPLKPFDRVVWYATLFTLFILPITDCLWILCDSLKNKPLKRHILIWRLRGSVLENFCFIINIAASRTIRNPSIMRFLFYAAIWFHGFFLSANYTSLLGSILTVTLFREQINTIQDLVRVNISVMIIDYEYDFLMSGGIILPEDFLKLIVKVDPATFEKHQVNLNKSYAYFVTDDKWRFLDMQQKHLKQGLFKLTDICFGSYNLGFPMETDSTIQRALEYFMRSLHSSGFLQHYEDMAFQYALQAGLVKRFTAATEYTSAHMEHVLLVFYMLIFAYILSTIIFLLENMHYRLAKRFQKRRKITN